MESENTPQFRNVKTHISDQSFCLPVEILEEILSRLPVKSLLKFRCVSKSWRSLVGSKRFIKKHLDNSTKNASFAHHGIILNSLRPHRGLKQCSLRSMLDDPFTNQFRFCDSLNIGAGSICVVGCCNGLVCILHEGKHFMLWNPSTRMTKKLPAIDHKIKHGHITSYGFGFDYLSCDYKVFGVLSVFWVTAGYEAISKVYSLGTNSWKLVKNGDASLSPFSEQGKFASGKLHWHRNVGLGSDIASFDLRSEAYGVVELPWYGDGFVESMEVMGGCLSMLCDYPSQFDIWIMKEYGVRESWEKVVTVPLPQLDNPLEYSYTFLLALGPNGEVLLTHGSTFVIYYPEGNGYRHFQVKNIAPFRYANVYVESLVPLIPCGEQVACSPEPVE